ncbi:unnamed protein product [Rotaria magnacalcarata]|uniref:Uncharacterized protein n=1 Tax=Rotaria magnacalcarata TaxID=392030 RepID=A0A8S2SWI0_9BILA|nr:unnamed protein product [Rotaria magnacalcarata]
MWSAYIASINDALSLVESKTVFLPSNLERLFGYVWARLINLIGMSRKNINLSETIKNQRAFLPRRMLLDKFLISPRFDWLSYIGNIWVKLTCNYEARVYARLTLESIALSKILTMKHLGHAIINAFLFRCDPSFKNDL